MHSAAVKQSGSKSDGLASVTDDDVTAVHYWLKNIDNLYGNIYSLEWEQIKENKLKLH